MSRPDKYLPWYFGDYLKDTQHLTPRQHGGYLLLLGHCWNLGGYLPHSSERRRALAQMSPKEWRDDGDTIMAFFTPCDRGYSQKRLTLELQKALAAYERRASAGAKGGRPKSNAFQAHAKANRKQPEPEPDNLGEGEGDLQDAFDPETGVVIPMRRVRP